MCAESIAAVASGSAGSNPTPHSTSAATDVGGTRHTGSMDDEAVMDLCTNLPSALLTHPFGFETEVFKVRGKVFALATFVTAPPRLTLKSRPDDVTELVREHAAITRGYHMNKKHWITIDLDESPDPNLVRQLVEESYALVIAGLPKARRPVA